MTFTSNPVGIGSPVPPVAVFQVNSGPYKFSAGSALKKIEELTLYLIEKDKKITELTSQLSDQQRQIDVIKAQLINKK